MGHSVVTHERINKQLNYEGYGLIRCHFCRLPVEHDRGSANRLPGPPDCCHLHHCRRSSSQLLLEPPPPSPPVPCSSERLPRKWLSSRSLQISNRRHFLPFL